MTNLGNTNPRLAEVTGTSVIAVDVRFAMAAFDALPSEIRDALRAVGFNIDPIGVWEAYRDGTPPARIVQAIHEQNARMNVKLRRKAEADCRTADQEAERRYHELLSRYSIP